MPRESFWLAPQDRIKVLASLGALAGAIALILAFIAVLAAFTYPSDATAGIEPIYVGHVDQFEVGKPVGYAPREFWMVKQEDGSFIAFFSRSPQGDCTVAWQDDLVFPDPETGKDKAGWFREPCHFSTWDAKGTRVFGSTPRNLDQFPVEIRGNDVYVRAVKQLLIRGELGPGVTLVR